MSFFRATVFLWMVGLEVIKQICCVFPSFREQSQIRQTTCFLLVIAPFSPTEKLKYLHTLLLLEVRVSVFSLTEEMEHSSVASVAIFTTWCLALAHAGLPWRASRVYRYYLYIYLLHITVHKFLSIYHIINIIAHH